MRAKRSKYDAQSREKRSYGKNLSFHLVSHHSESV
jgi:hypothetical protein